MSKMDGLRAMREARYAERAARATQPTATQPTPGATTPRARQQSPGRPASEPTVSDQLEAAPEVQQDHLCGHRAISGRTCTRERGHSAKSHRYS